VSEDESHRVPQGGQAGMSHSGKRKRNTRTPTERKQTENAAGTPQSLAHNTGRRYDFVWVHMSY
jgi:hypothetical protein